MHADGPGASSRPMAHDTGDRIHNYHSTGAVFNGDGIGGGQQFCGPYYDNRLRVFHSHFPSWAQKKRFWVTHLVIALITASGAMAASIAVLIEKKGGYGPYNSGQSSMVITSIHT